MAVILSNVCFSRRRRRSMVPLNHNIKHQHSTSNINTNIQLVSLQQLSSQYTHYIKVDIHYTTTQSHHYEAKLLFYHYSPSSIFFTTTNECFLHIQSIYSHPTFHHHTLSPHHHSIHFQTPSTSYTQSHPICNKTITHQSHYQSKQPTI